MSYFFPNNTTWHTFYFSYKYQVIDILVSCAFYFKHDGLEEMPRNLLILLLVVYLLLLCTPSQTVFYERKVRTDISGAGPGWRSPTWEASGDSPCHPGEGRGHSSSIPLGTATGQSTERSWGSGQRAAPWGPQSKHKPAGLSSPGRAAWPPAQAESTAPAPAGWWEHRGLPGASLVCLPRQPSRWPCQGPSGAPAAVPTPTWGSASQGATLRHRLSTDPGVGGGAPDKQQQAI